MTQVSASLAANNTDLSAAAPAVAVNNSAFTRVLEKVMSCISAIVSFFTPEPSYGTKLYNQEERTIAYILGNNKDFYTNAIKINRLEKAFLSVKREIANAHLQGGISMDSGAKIYTLYGDAIAALKA